MNASTTTGPHNSRLFASTIFLSAGLLFLVQPLIAKQITPWFGGTSAVWTVCMVFFQTVLLAGYAYAHGTTRWLGNRPQAVLHTALLALSLLSLPIVASAGWKPTGQEEPTWRILGLLTATIGLPYFLLATTGPLVQTWFARAFPDREVYRLFALSNLASLLGLVSYPFAIEPWLTTTQQARLWSIGYAAFAVLGAGAALSGLRRGRTPAAPPESSGMKEFQEHNDPTDRGESATHSRRLRIFLWLALPTMSTWLLLAVTNHISQNIASVPFLWLLPLTLYLATFIIVFDHQRWYRRGLIIGLALATLCACAYCLTLKPNALKVTTAIPLYTGGLFVVCLFCHGELARLKPRPRDLTTFYLVMSAGGVLGGLVVGVMAPRVLHSSYELGIGLTITAGLAALLLRRQFVLVPIAALGVAVACGYFSVQQVREQRTGTRVLERSFYGTLRVEDRGRPDQFQWDRQLTNGTILHGLQYLAPDRRREAGTYYGSGSGVGAALTLMDRPNRRVGVIGLGTGTLATYGRPGDVFRFYEINPQVVNLAEREFTFLQDSRARIEIALGDARLNLERESPQAFDLLAIDAFSSDAIPVHLVTLEALAVYRRHLKPGGVVAFHVSNRFLDLAPVVIQIARAQGFDTIRVVDQIAGGGFAESHWVLVTTDQAFLNKVSEGWAVRATGEIPGLLPWTDNYSNLFQILR